MQHGELDDARATDPVERLLEDSWETRKQRASRREVLVEAVAAALFLSVATPLAAPDLAGHGLNVVLAGMLVALYALVAGSVRFPIGAGYVVPTYVMLVPMLLLLPPATVPLFVAAGLVLASLVRLAARRVSVDHVLFSIPNAWHALGPAVVLILFGLHHGAPELAAIYLLAFLAGCVVDLVTSTIREAAALAVAPRLQLRVVALVWLIDVCTAPIGLLLAYSARRDHFSLLMVLPLSALLLLLDRDRSTRIDQAQHRLELVGRERTRLQAAVRRLGDAFAAKLDLPALSSIVLHGSIDALDADAGQVTLDVPSRPPLTDTAGPPGFAPLLEEANRRALRSHKPEQLERDGVWALALPFGPEGNAQSRGGALCVARHVRQFGRERAHEEETHSRTGADRPAHGPRQSPQARHRPHRAARTGREGHR